MGLLDLRHTKLWKILTRKKNRCRFMMRMKQKNYNFLEENQIFLHKDAL